jgi:NAD(P)-dependent dehydrogenase (short-subunit alcohol dehydrogenase family)
VAEAREMQAFADAVHAVRPAVDVLVNNAGVGLGGGFLETSLQDWDWVLRINLWGVIHGCHVFVPAMVRRAQGGHVVNVASAAGLVATSQLVPHRIGVTAVCPGIINTPITRSSRMVGRYGTPAARESLVRAYQRRGYGPERVAENILRAVRKGRPVAPISPEAWVMYYLKRLAPRLTARINRVVQERMERELQGAAGEP